MLWRFHNFWIRPYSVEYTRSRSISEVKQLQAGLVLGWVTAWESPVPYPFLLLYVLMLPNIDKDSPFFHKYKMPDALMNIKLHSNIG